MSLSGMQPKLGVIKKDGRYVGRTKDEDTYIIAKLPVVAFPLLPEVEDLSLRLAKAAGVNVCDAYLEPLGKLGAQHQYDLGDIAPETNFLAVVRYDRKPGGRVHCEDFAQILGLVLEDKYSSTLSYLEVAAILMSFPSLGEGAVHELLRRIIVNELLGNPDMHLKNIGLWYPDGKTPELPPAYDIVANSLYVSATGHGLRILPAHIEETLSHKDLAEAKSRKVSLRPAVLRVFCNELGIPERPAAQAVGDCIKAAYGAWPEMIESSQLQAMQKGKLLHHVKKHPLVEGLARRRKKGKP